MRSTPTSGYDRRSVLGLVAVGAPILIGAPFAVNAAPPKVYDMLVHRDSNCGCCRGWTTLMQRTGRFKTTLKDEPDMPALKRLLKVPDDLASCHTAQVGRLLIEGHVPATDILRVLDGRSAQILGLAVPGMPMGSPGMEQPGGERSAFNVYSFDYKGKRKVFAHYAAD